jgi:hypothetical protein
MKAFVFVSAIWGFSLYLSAAAYADALLINPDDVTIFLLQQKFSNSNPDLVALSQGDPAVKAADEFHQQAAIDQDVAQLKADEATLQGVTTIVLNLDSSFSPYDSDYNEYDFDISDATYISYSLWGQQFQIDLTNGTDAQSWSLKPDEAEKVLDRNNGSRNVTLVLTLKLLDSPAPVAGQPAVLNAQIVSYDVLAETGSMRLGHVVVSSTP